MCAGVTKHPENTRIRGMGMAIAAIGRGFKSHRFRQKNPAILVMTGFSLCRALRQMRLLLFLPPRRLDFRPTGTLG